MLGSLFSETPILQIFKVLPPYFGAARAPTLAPRFASAYSAEALLSFGAFASFRALGFKALGL